MIGPEARLAVVLVGSLALWFPALTSVLRGQLDAGAALVRFGVGAATMWVVLAALDRLLTGYAMSPDTGGATPKRRADDRADEVSDDGLDVETDGA